MHEDVPGWGRERRQPKSPVGFAEAELGIAGAKLGVAGQRPMVSPGINRLVRTHSSKC